MKKIILSVVLIFASLDISHAQQEVDTCFAYIKAGDYQRAFEAGKKAVKLYPKNGGANYCLGDAYARIGQFKLALPYMKEAERISTSKQDLMFVYNKLGLIFDGMGDYDNALFYDNKYLFLARELGNKKEEATALNNIAGIFNAKGITDKALSYYEESLKLKDEQDKAATYNNIGGIYHQKGEFQKAIEYGKKALEISERNGDYHGAARGMLNLGDTYRETKDFVHAEEYLTQGLKSILKVGDKNWEANAYKYLGRFYRDKGEIHKAKDYLTKAYNLYDSIGAKGDAQDALEGLKELDNTKGAAE